ncbi:hypothetical protein Poli38472_006845 [Pythium oligandrum]|uniref:Uncharacterized protein n=1 Tax=Pythium oligandrum TaxID=41045 RepID=A0A8K1FB28_PYTOL|nr:hypothetical protein Poli38472_006845 [Pythium oligandrum]|eukprot:TMW56835.1 hypothetical protein Poli38472_006845 [Pythium oligandrum]
MLCSRHFLKSMKNEEKHKRSRGDSIDGSIRGEYIAFLKAALKDAKAEAEKRVTEAEAEADKRIAEADKRIVEAKAEADKRIVEAKAEADKRIAEIKADAKERIAEIKTDAKERIVEAKADAKERIAEANELTKEAIAAGDKRLSQLFNFGHDMLGNLNRKSTPALERSQAAIRNKKQIAQGCQVRLLEKDREFGFNFLVGLEQELDVESNNAIEGLVRSTEVKSSVAVTKFKRIKNPKSLIKHCVDCVRDACIR